MSTDAGPRGADPLVHVPSLPSYQMLLAAFRHASGRYDGADLYRRWLECSWAFANAAYDRAGFVRTLDAYSAAEGREFGRIFFELYVPTATEARGADVLGPLFMELCGGSRSKLWNGQAFTPWNVAYLMASMMLGDAEALRAEFAAKGRLSCCDPCCGSGVMLLAAARVIHDTLGPAYLRRVDLYGQDIDLRCALMTRLQLRVNGLDHFGQLVRLATALDGARRADVPDPRPVLFGWRGTGTQG